ncbi:MAG TPA: UDP-3-O-(3-hydroxymyristoyl)glucosamine N-acyltransferase [Candidatus Saccharimonadales bacterium]|nr:UDP-3-O-(3-hydroxymyristoyl)glucosamine N-acyltransferase [Candidatus Saccharimonadales bacterium]
MKLSEIAQILGASLENAAPEAEITGVAGIEDASPQQITFISNPKYSAMARTTHAAAILVPLDFPADGLPVLRIANPYLAFARTLELFYQAPKYEPGIHPTAVIDPTASIGAGAHIGPYVVVDADVVIGEQSVLLAHVVIYRGAKIGQRFFAHSHVQVREFCELGNDVTLQNGVVIGADGFGFARDGAAGWHKIVQSGITRLADRVEVQANSCVDRASIGQTTVGADTKIDNLVQVGHGCKIGEHTMLCSQVGVGGSSHVGDNVILAGQVGVAGHLTIGDRAIATAQTGIPSDVAAGATVSGYPAIDNRQWLRAVAVFNKLPELAKAIRKLSRGTE